MKPHEVVELLEVTEIEGVSIAIGDYEGPQSDYNDEARIELSLWRWDSRTKGGPDEIHGDLKLIVMDIAEGNADFSDMTLALDTRQQIDELISGLQWLREKVTQ